MGEPEYTLLSERSPPEKAAYYMVPIIWHSEEANCEESKKNSGYQGVGVKEGMKRWSTENF